MSGEHFPAGRKGTTEGRPGLLEVNYTQMSLGVWPGHFKCVEVQTEVLHISLGLCSAAQGSEEGIRFCQSIGVSLSLCIRVVPVGLDVQGWRPVTKCSSHAFREPDGV